MHRQPQNIAQKLKQRADARNVIDFVAQELASFANFLKEYLHCCGPVGELD